MMIFGEKKIEYAASGLFQTDEKWIHPARVERTYEIICVKEGAVYLEEDGEAYEMKKGSLIILRPEIEHKGYFESEGRTSFYWLHFFADSLDAWRISERYIENFTNVIMFSQFLHIANTKEYPPYAAEALLLSILAEISTLTKQGDVEESTLIKNAAEWVRINSMNKLNVCEISEMYGYNSEHFSRMFRRKYGVGLKEFICDERMKAAKNLLTNSAYSIKQVSQMMSFDDENQFINFFKYHQNQSPKKFRNSIYNTHMNKK